MTNICVSNQTIIGSDNGLSPGRRQAIIWSNSGILLIRTLGTKFSEILSKIQTFSFKKIHFKMSSAKWRPFCLGLNVLTTSDRCHATVGSVSQPMTAITHLGLEILLAILQAQQFLCLRVHPCMCYFCDYFIGNPVFHWFYCGTTYAFVKIFSEK